MGPRLKIAGTFFVSKTRADQAETRMDVTSAPIYQTLDSSQKTITEYCDGNTEWEAKHELKMREALVGTL